MSADCFPAPFDAVSPGAVPPNPPIPRHIAIMMDGNGRWAERRGLPRPEGHVRGSAIVSPLVEEAARLGVERLTLYCFSSENWKRPQAELDALMGLLKAYMIDRRPTLAAQNVRLRVVGRRAGIPADVLAEMDKTVEASANNDGLTLALAINYGSRLEIVDAARAIVAELSDPVSRAAALEKAGVSTVDELLDERYFASRLYEPDAPDPDLLIRTGGEMRLSNYLLWQLSYSELWVSDVLWPDFTKETLWNAIRAFQKRKRRFGGLNAPEKADGVF